MKTFSANGKAIYKTIDSGRVSGDPISDDLLKSPDFKFVDLSDRHHIITSVNCKAIEAVAKLDSESYFRCQMRKKCFNLLFCFFLFVIVLLPFVFC